MPVQCVYSSERPKLQINVTSSACVKNFKYGQNFLWWTNFKCNSKDMRHANFRKTVEFSEAGDDLQIYG